MKKKLKIILSIISILVLCVGGYAVYILKFKTYDVADESVNEIVEESFEVELPDGTILRLDKDGEMIEEESENAGQATGTIATGSSSNSSNAGKTVSNTPDNANKGTSSSTETGKGSASKPASNPGKQEAGKPKQSVAVIKSKYVPTFDALEGQADAKLNALIGRAKNEYTTKKANGEKIDYGYFFNKYSGAAGELESRTDAVFNGVLKAVERDLENNGFDKAYAKSFAEQYNAQKKSRKESLMKKVTGL